MNWSHHRDRRGRPSSSVGKPGAPGALVGTFLQSEPQRKEERVPSPQSSEEDGHGSSRSPMRKLSKLLIFFTPDELRVIKPFQIKTSKTHL